MIVLLFTALLGIIIYLQSRKEMSRWQLAFQETFSSEESLKEWYIDSSNLSYDRIKGVWGIVDSALYVGSSGFSFLRFERPFTRDIRVEFDIRAEVKDLFNAGIFICGSHPDSGYAFHIH